MKQLLLIPLPILPFVFVILLLSNQTFSQKVLVLSDSSENYSLSPYLEIMFDTSGKITLDDVIDASHKEQFQEFAKEYESLGYRKESIWLKFSVRNMSIENIRWILNFNYAVYDKVSFYMPNKDGNYLVQRSGLFYNFIERAIENRLVTFEINLDTQFEKTYYLNIESGKSIPLQLEINAPKYFNYSEQNNYLIRGLFYGGILILALYNLFLFFSVKDISYLYYSLYAVFVCIYQTANDGLSYQYFTPNFNKFNLEYGILSINLVVITGSLFTKKFLQLKNYSKLLNNILTLLIIFTFFYSILVLIKQDSNSSLTPYYGLIYFIFLIVVCIYCLIKGSKNAFYYLIAISSFVILVFFRGFRNLGIISSSFLSDYGVQIGMLIEMAILSFALGNRINEIKRSEEKEKASIRSRIASDLHDEIGSNLSSISVASQMLVKSRNLQEDEKHQLEDITATAKESAESMRDIIWFINPTNDNPVDIIQKMKETATKMLPDTNYNFICNDCKILDNKDLSFRRNLFLIYKEILNNIVKHSSAKNVTIKFYDESKKIILEVNDDGVGFNNSNCSGNGYGLKNIKNRAESLGGTATVTTLNGHGTEWKIVI